MGNAPEQFKFNFDNPEAKKPGTPEMELHERDECEACGNFFAGPGSCRQCMRDKRKMEWQNEHPNKKETRH